MADRHPFVVARIDLRGGRQLRPWYHNRNNFLRVVSLTSRLKVGKDEEAAPELNEIQKKYKDNEGVPETYN